MSKTIEAPFLTFDNLYSFLMFLHNITIQWGVVSLVKYTWMFLAPSFWFLLLVVVVINDAVGMVGNWLVSVVVFWIPKSNIWISFSIVPCRSLIVYSLFSSSLATYVFFVSVGSFPNMMGTRSAHMNHCFSVVMTNCACDFLWCHGKVGDWWVGCLDWAGQVRLACGSEPVLGSNTWVFVFSCI